MNLETPPAAVFASGRGNRTPAGRTRYSIAEIDEVIGVCDDIAKTLESIILSRPIFSPDEPRHAYVSFVTHDYAWGLVAWLRSLRAVSKTPVFLLVNRELTPPEGIDGVFQIIVPGLGNDAYAFDRPEFAHVLSKLWIFALTPLTRLIFVDIDCVFLRSVDHLFETSGILVCPDFVETRDSHRFNSGVLVFSPSRALRDQVFAGAVAAESIDGGDQGALNVILGDVVQFLPESYNLLRHFNYFAAKSSLDEVFIVHFIVKKPWNLHYQEAPDAMLAPLDDVWTSFLEPDELRKLMAEWRRAVFHRGERAKIEAAGGQALEALSRRLQALEKRARERTIFSRHLLAFLVGVAVGAGGIALLGMLRT